MSPYNKPIETPGKGLKKYNCRVPEYVGAGFRKCKARGEGGWGGWEVWCIRHWLPQRCQSRVKRTPLSLTKSPGIFNELDMVLCLYLIPLCTHSHPPGSSLPVWSVGIQSLSSPFIMEIRDNQSFNTKQIPVPCKAILWHLPSSGPLRSCR